MPNRIEIDKEQFEEIMWGSGYKDVEEVEESHFKHDITTYTVAFPFQGKHYLMSYNSSYEHGIADWDFPLVAEEARKVEKVFKVWKIV